MCKFVQKHLIALVSEFHNHKRALKHRGNNMAGQETIMSAICKSQVFVKCTVWNTESLRKDWPAGTLYFEKSFRILKGQRPRNQFYHQL